MTKSKGSGWTVFFILAGFVMFALATWLLGPFIGIATTLRHWQSDLEAAGVPSRLAYGFVTIGSIPFVFASIRLIPKFNGWLGKGWPRSHMFNVIVVLVYMGGMSIVVWALTAGNIVGRPYCPADLTVFEKNAKSDTCLVHGLPLGVVTASVARVIHAKSHGADVTPREIDLPPDGPFFDTRTGLAVAYFGEDMSGRLRAYSFPGVNPYDRTPLHEPTTLVRMRWKSDKVAEIQLAENRKAAAEEEAERQHLAEQARQRQHAETQRRIEAAKPYHSRYESRPLPELLRQAAMQPDNADLHYAIGMLLAAQGDQAGASRSFHEALRANSNMKHARLRLQDLGETP